MRKSELLAPGKSHKSLNHADWSNLEKFKTRFVILTYKESRNGGYKWNMEAADVAQDCTIRVWRLPGIP